MKKLLTAFLVFIVSLALFIACNDNTSTSATEDTKSTFDIGSAKAAIDSVNVLYGNLVSKGDSVGLAALYTSNAMLMGANFPAATGTKAIVSAFSELFKQTGPVGLTLTANEVAGNEEQVSEVGVYTMTKDGKEIDRGKYIVLWKMEDGKWKLHRDCFNSDNPPAPASK